MVHMLKVCPYDGAREYFKHKAQAYAKWDPKVYGELPRLLESAMKEKR